MYMYISVTLFLYYLLDIGVYQQDYELSGVCMYTCPFSIYKYMYVHMFFYVHVCIMFRVHACACVYTFTAVCTCTCTCGN